MGATRFVGNIREGVTTLSFDCVVRDAFNAVTYGGGRVTWLKADLALDPLLDPTIDDAKFEAAFDKAVADIIAKGNDAFPKVRPPDGEEPQEFVRRFHALAVEKNVADRPSRRDPFGSR